MQKVNKLNNRQIFTKSPQTQLFAIYSVMWRFSIMRVENIEPYKGAKMIPCRNCGKKVKRYYANIKAQKAVYCSRHCTYNRNSDKVVQLKIEKTIRSKTHKKNLLELIDKYLQFLPLCKTSRQRESLIKEVEKLRDRVSKKEKQMQIIDFKVMTVESDLQFMK